MSDQIHPLDLALFRELMTRKELQQQQLANTALRLEHAQKELARKYQIGQGDQVQLDTGAIVRAPKPAAPAANGKKRK